MDGQIARILIIVLYTVQIGGLVGLTTTGKGSSEEVRLLNQIHSLPFGTVLNTMGLPAAI